MAVKNSTILAKAWLEGTGDYQQRVPSPTVATQKQTMEAIFSPFNGPIYNQFIDTLFTRIGLVYARQQAWRNPLAAFKRGTLEYGGSVQELATAWIRAHTYKDDAQTLLKVHRPEVEQAIHQLNRFDQYPLSVNKIELKTAFTDEYGLNSLISSIMDVAINSEQYDEYLQMKELIAWYENTWGFFKINGAMPEDDTSAKAFLKSLRTMVAKLAFPSTLYNAGIVPDIPVFARPDELVLLISPEASASVDVDTLAALFNLEKAEAQVRQIIVDEFPIPGAYAMLTTEDWFQVYDQTYENGSFYNPETLTTNYYLTVMQVISCSPFVPAIVWTTEAGTETGTITLTTSNTVNAVQAIRSGCSGCFEAMPAGTKLTKAMVTGKNGDGTPAAVNGVYLFGELQGSLSDGTITGAQEIDGVTVRPDAYVVRDMTFAGSGAPVRNSRTYIDRLGRLHLQAGAYKGNEDLTLTVTIEPTYNNPSGDTPAPVATTVTFTIAAAGGDEPEPGHHDGADFVSFLYVNPVTGDGVTLSQEQLRNNPSAAFDETAGGALSYVGFIPATGDDLPAVTAASVTITAGTKTETRAASFSIDKWAVSGLDSVVTAEDYEAAGGEATVVVTITAGGEDYTVTVPVTIEAVPVPLTVPDFLTRLAINQAGSTSSEDIILTQQQLRDNPSATIVTGLGAIDDLNMFKASDATLPEVTAVSATVTAGNVTETKAVADVSQPVWSLMGFASDVTPSDYETAGNEGSLALSITAGGETYTLTIPVTVAIPVNPFERVKLQKNGVTVAIVDMSQANWTTTIQEQKFDSIVVEDLPSGATDLRAGYTIGTQLGVLEGTISGTTGTIPVSAINAYSSRDVSVGYTLEGQRTTSGTGTITITPSPFKEVIMQIKDGGSTTVDMTTPSWSFDAGAYCVSEVKVYDPDGAYSRMILGYTDDTSETRYIMSSTDGLYKVFDTESAFQVSTVGSKTINGVYVSASSGSGATSRSETGSVTVTLS